MALAVVLTLTLAGCGIEAGDNSPARTTPTTKFHRTPIGFPESVSIDIEMTDSGCQATPADLEFPTGSRVQMHIQNQSEEGVELTYAIPDLEISGPAGAARFADNEEVNITIPPGPRPRFDFNVVSSSGTFDILCQDEKVGTLTVS